MNRMTETSREYAEALFLLTKESGMEQQALKDLRFVEDLFKANPDYQLLLVSPAIPMSERSQALENALSGAILDPVLCFLRLFCEKGHISELSSCIEIFNDLCEESQKTTTAYVTSVVPLTDEEQGILKAKLEAMSGHRVRLDCTLDPSILGGVVVNMDGSVLDGSLRRRLTEMKEVMER